MRLSFLELPGHERLLHFEQAAARKAARNRDGAT